MPHLHMHTTWPMLHMHPTCTTLHMHPTHSTNVRHELMEPLLMVWRWYHRWRWHGRHWRRRRGVGKVGWVSPGGHPRRWVVWDWCLMHRMPVQSVPKALHACQWMRKHLLKLRYTAIVRLRLLWGLRLRCQLLAGVDVPSNLVRHKTKLLTRQQRHTYVLISPAQLSSRDTTPGHQFHPTAEWICAKGRCNPYREVL
jgi:hypothetical protein